MQLLDEIIDLAVNDQASISVLLRKCLVLAYRLNNERLRAWTDKELNGYGSVDELPEYRKVPATARGLFIGPFGMALRDQPLQSSVMDKEHRHFATTAMLAQPIIAYEQQNTDNANAKPTIPWPADLTAKYQTLFLKDKDLVLNRAWIEIGNRVLPAVVGTVRNRVLRFALELKEELGLVNDDLGALPQGKVDQTVTNYIFGGANVIAGTAQKFTQVSAVNVGKGDMNGLLTALRNVGISDPDVAELEAALKGDAAEANAGTWSFGQRTTAWLKGLGPKLAKAGTQIAVDVAKGEALKLISEHLGLL